MPRGSSDPLKNILARSEAAKLAEQEELAGASKRPSTGQLKRFNWALIAGCASLLPRQTHHRVRQRHRHQRMRLRFGIRVDVHAGRSY